MFVCVLSLSRKVAGCQRFWTKFSGFSGSSFSSLFMALAAICQHVSSQIQLPLVWVKIYPHVAYVVLLWKQALIFTQDTWHIKYVRFIIFVLFFTNVHNLLQAQGGKSSWQSHEISFLQLKYLMSYNFFFFWMNLWVNFNPLRLVKVNALHCASLKH